jgi:hypothetical protein
MGRGERALRPIDPLLFARILDRFDRTIGHLEDAKNTDDAVSRNALIDTSIAFVTGARRIFADEMQRQDGAER